MPKGFGAQEMPKGFGAQEMAYLFSKGGLAAGSSILQLLEESVSEGGTGRRRPPASGSCQLSCPKQPTQQKAASTGTGTHRRYQVSKAMLQLSKAVGIVTW